jgi:hypothetical protein
MHASRRLTAVTIGSLAVSLGLWGAGYLPTASAAITTSTYYFHGGSNDDVDRANSEPSATFDQTAPTGTSDSTQTGSIDANAEVAGNPLAVYWTGPFTGHINGNMHFDWYWSTVNPTTTIAGETATVTIYGDGAKIGQGDVELTIGTSPTLNHSDVAAVNGIVTSTLLVQVTVDHVDTGNGVTAHYNSTAAPSSFQVPLDDSSGGGGGGGGGTGGGPEPCTSTLCFSPPLVLPASGDTGDTDKTCYNPCGEPSLAVSPVDGTLYVSTPRTILVCCNSKSSPVWMSSDDGETWSDPIFPPGGEDATTGGDTELAVDKRGTVYEGELWLGSDSIYISTDVASKGADATWDWSPASHDLVADREWFAYEPKEDALYGYYDGFKGLMVAKAPLNTPLGSNAARFFPEEKIIVPECAAAVAVNCPNVPVDEVAGTPVIHQATSPGRPSVSPVDGTVYFPFPYQVAGKGIGIAYTEDGGSSYKYSYVAGAGHGDFGDTGNDFPVSAVGSDGRLYVAWVEDKGDGYNLYLASSADKGATWTTPLELSKGVSSTAVFPNVVAGAPGQVAVSWYGTSASGDPNGVPGSASWDVYATEVTDIAGTPAITNGVVQHGFHKGPICTHGTGCTGNSRNLLDFFDMQLDGQGRLGIVYTRDQSTNADLTEIAYSHQDTGCLLPSDCAVGAALAEFPTQIAPVFFGVAVIGGVLLFHRRRRHLSLPS